MAFFNLTSLGIQDPIKQSLKCDESGTAAALNSFQEQRLQGGLQNGGSEGQGLNTRQQSSSRVGSSRTGLTQHKHTSEAQGSHALFTQRLMKHQRAEFAPNEMYRKQITSSQELGWWSKGDAPENLSWTKTERHSRVNSEMSRFVDEMALTDKHFSLF